MGFLDSIFNSKSTTNNGGVGSENTLVWRQLEDVSQLDAVEELSKEKLVVIFKHSKRCGISHMVWDRFQNTIDFTNEHIEMLYLDLLAHRDISNEITQRFKVLHQSPQILVIKSGKVIHHASHSAIHVSDIHELLP